MRSACTRNLAARGTWHLAPHQAPGTWHGHAEGAYLRGMASNIFSMLSSTLTVDFTLASR
jgi:hypothetical protein